MSLRINIIFLRGKEGIHHTIIANYTTEFFGKCSSKNEI